MNPTPSGRARNSSTFLVTRGSYVLPFPFWKCHYNCHLRRSLYHLWYHHVVTSGTPHILHIYSVPIYLRWHLFTAFIEEPHQFESTQCTTTQPHKREPFPKFKVCHDYGLKRNSKGITRMDRTSTKLHDTRPTKWWKFCSFSVSIQYRCCSKF